MSMKIGYWMNDALQYAGRHVGWQTYNQKTYKIRMAVERLEKLGLVKVIRSKSAHNLFRITAAGVKYLKERNNAKE